MTRILTTRLRVTPDSIDGNGHVNNREYLRWMQEVAIAHTTALGWPMERYFDAGATWVVRSHYIEYVRPAFDGDALDAHTWIADLDSPRSTRRYLFTRDGGRSGTQLIVRAETLWVFVDLETGRPLDVPGALRNDFPLVDAEEAATHAGIRRSRARPPPRGPG